MQQINQFFSLIIVSEELKSIEKHKGDPTKYTSIHARLILLRLTNKRIEKKLKIISELKIWKLWRIVNNIVHEVLGYS